MQPDLVAIERQKRWEIDGVQRGVRRFREGLRDGGLLSVPAGMEAAADIVRNMIPEIERMQKLTRTNARGAYPWLEVFQLLPADVLAVLTINAVFSDADKFRGYDRLWSSLALTVSASARVQIEYDQWEDGEAQRKKEARASRAPYVDMRERLRRSSKTIDRVAWSRFRRRIQALASDPWPKVLRIHVGSALLTVAVENGGGWFKALKVPVIRGRGKTETRLRLSDAAVAFFENTLVRNELSRPMRVPMVAPPRPWIREEKAGS